MALATVNQPKIFLQNHSLLFNLYCFYHFLQIVLLRCCKVFQQMNNNFKNINIYLAVTSDRQSNSFFLKVLREASHQFVINDLLD